MCQAAFSSARRWLQRHRFASVYGGLAVFLAGAVVGAVAAGAIDVGGGSAASVPEEDCGAGIMLGGSSYDGVEVPGNEVVEQRPDGVRAALDACLRETVALRAIVGIDPAVAVTREDNTALYVLHGRCDGFTGWDGFFGCLQRRLRFEGRAYAAIRLPNRVAAGARLGAGTLLRGNEVRTVDVRAVATLDADEAVAVGGSQQVVFVADEACNRAGVVLTDCLGIS